MVCIPNFRSFHLLMKANLQMSIDGLGPVKKLEDLKKRKKKKYCLLFEMSSMYLEKCCGTKL